MSGAGESAALNTDRELFREDTGERAGSYYENSLHVTAQGAIGMNVGGTVYTLPIARWHALADASLSVVDDYDYTAADVQERRPDRPGLRGKKSGPNSEHSCRKDHLPKPRRWRLGQVRACVCGQVYACQMWGILAPRPSWLPVFIDHLLGSPFRPANPTQPTTPGEPT